MERQIREENGKFHPTPCVYTMHTQKFNKIQSDAGGKGEGWYAASRTLGLEENPQPPYVAGPRAAHRYFPPVWQLKSATKDLSPFLSAVGSFSNGRVNPPVLSYSVWRAVGDKNNRRIGGADDLVLISNTEGSGGGWALVALDEAGRTEFEDGLLALAVKGLLGALA